MADLNRTLENINLILPLGIYALEKLFAAFKRDRPEDPKTFEEFIEEIRTEAAQTKDIIAPRLQALGFEQNGLGEWVPRQD